MTEALITGWAHSVFGRLPEPSVQALMDGVASQALEHAGIAADDVDGIFVGVYNGGFSRQGFEAAQVALDLPELAYTPAVRAENACATGSAAINAALDFIESGRGRVALVVGAEKMTATPPAELTDILLSASYRTEESGVKGGFAGLFAQIAQSYFARFGDRSAELAMIAAKNHANGVSNPYAQMRKDFGFEFCNTVSERNPYIAPPLRRTDCSLVSDGAAAMVIVSPELAIGAARAIGFRARTHVNDHLPLSRRDATVFEGARRAWREALACSGNTLSDLDLVETHDCFTIAELLQYEAMGLAEPGRGGDIIREGISHKGGRLPINPSGGLKSRGHPIGATGLSQHIMACLQLVNEAGEMQIPGASIAGVFNMGGAAVTNYVSLLERRL